MSHSIGGGVGAAGARVAHRHVAGAAGDVEQPKGAVAARRIELRDEVALPQPVQTARHQVVHQVVALGDRREHAVDEALALALGDVAEAEARLRVSCSDGSVMGATIAKPAPPRAMSARDPRPIDAKPPICPSYPKSKRCGAVSRRRCQGKAFERVEQHRPDLRFPLPEGFAARLRGRKVERLQRRAKYLLAHLSGGEVLLMHLGMTGRFTVHAQPQAVPALTDTR